jgi:large subunit ribosomal protein L23
MNQERVYTVLVEPHFTEKVSGLGDNSNQYAFKVATDATKAEIKEAVETLFQVSVENVSTLNVKGKRKSTQRGMSRKKDWKKAYVRVSAGQDIDFMVTD